MELIVNLFLLFLLGDSVIVGENTKIKIFQFEKDIKSQKKHFGIYLSDFLLRQVFHECNVFVVHKNGELENSMIKFHDKSVQNDTPRISGSSSSDFPLLMDFIRRLDKDFYIVNLFDFTSNSSTYPFNFNKSTRKKSRNCALTLGFVYEDPLSFFIPFSHIFFKNLKSVMRGDEDHFLFFTEEKFSKSLMFSPTAMEIKFKLIFFPYLKPSTVSRSVSKDTSVGRLKIEGIKIQTLCFYCGMMGAPKIIEMDLGQEKNLPLIDIFSSSLRTEIVDRLFPDWANQGNGKVLRTPCQTRVHFIYEITKLNDGRWIYKRGYAWRLLEAILTTYNFTYFAFPATTGGGSGTLKNGKWNGCVFDILENVGDVAVAVTTDVNRYKVLTGTKPMAFEYLNFMLSEPKKTYSWTSIFYPLDKFVWVAVLTSIILLVLTFNFIKKVNKNNVQKRDLRIEKELRKSGLDKQRIKDSLNHRTNASLHHSKQKFDHRITENLMFILLEQNIDYPSKVTAKLLCGLWMFTACILCTAYRSKLCGIMTFPTLQRQPNSFAELAQSKNFKWGLEGASVGSSAHNFFLTSPSPLYKQIYERMEFEPISRKCMERSITSNFACLTFNGQAEYLIYRNYSNRNGKIPLKLSPDSAALAMPAIAMRKRSVFRTNFDRVVESTKEMGVITKWKWLDWAQERRKHWLYLKREKEKGIPDDDALPSEDGPPVLILKNLKGPFFLLIGGNLTGVIFCLVEILRRKVNLKQIMKKSESSNNINNNSNNTSREKSKGREQLEQFNTNFPSQFANSDIQSNFPSVFSQATTDDYSNRHEMNDFSAVYSNRTNYQSNFVTETTIANTSRSNFVLHNEQENSLMSKLLQFIRKKIGN